MTAKEEHRYKRLNDLQRNGVQVRKSSDIRFNSGSETGQHIVCKALAGHVMQQAGWVVNGEVEIEGQGDVDVLAWGRQGYLDWAIEVETSPPEGIQEKYLEQYIYPTPINDLVILNCNDMPSNFTDALAWVSDQLPAQI